MFDLQLLGRVDLRDADGRTRHSVLSQTKRFALLAYLGASPDFVRRDVLIAVFWPELDEDRARRALSQAIYHIRRALGEDVQQIIARAVDCSQFASRPPSLDAYRLYAQGIDAFVRGEEEQASTNLIAAYSLDGSFTAPLIWAAYANHNMGNYEERNHVVELLAAVRDSLQPWDRAMADIWIARLGGRPMEEFMAARRVARLAPGSEWDYKLALAAMNAGVHEEAAAAFGRLYPFNRGWLEEWGCAVWSPYLSTLHGLGDYDALYRGAREHSERCPGAVGLGFGYEALALVGLGREDDPRRLVVNFLDDREGLDYFQAVFNLAVLLMIHGQVDWGQSLLEGELENWRAQPAPDQVSGQLLAGLTLMALGRMEEAWALVAPLAAWTTWDRERPWRYAGYGVLAARVGRFDEARRVLEHFETLDGGDVVGDAVGVSRVDHPPPGGRRGCG